MKEYEIASGVFGRPRKLILAENYLEWKNKDSKEFTRLNKLDIVDFKHSVDWIVWYRFVVGRQFSITFKDKHNKELIILFNSYFGVRKEYNELYSDMVHDIWKLYFSDVVDTYLNKFYRKQPIELKGIKLNESGIQLNGQNSTLPWHNVNIKEYYKYFAVYQKDNPDVHSRVSYNEYETEILWSILKTILKVKDDESQ